MGGTDLDAVLRDLGASTIVAIGVSVNLSVTRNLHHHNMLSLLATITTTDDLLNIWE